MTAAFVFVAIGKKRVNLLHGGVLIDADCLLFERPPRDRGKRPIQRSVRNMRLLFLTGESVALRYTMPQKIIRKSVFVFYFYFFATAGSPRFFCSYLKVGRLSESARPT